MMDFAKRMCQHSGAFYLDRWSDGMKVNVEIDCTPEEARRFLGLPDVTSVNEAYAEALTKAVKGVGSLEQLQEMGKMIAPMGQMGMHLFQQLMEGAAGLAGAAGKKRAK